MKYHFVILFFLSYNLFSQISLPTFYGIQKLDAPIPSISVSLSISSTSICEAARVSTVTATSSAAPSQNVTVTLTATGTATAGGTDYTLASSTITINAGATTGTTTITAVQDALNEGNETVILDITGVANATENGNQQVIVTILDDDDTGAGRGGLGAKISGEFNLSAGTVLKILVGQKGNQTSKDASGGGGTFVTQSPHNTNNSILVVAGGGGGSFVNNSISNGQITTYGADAFCSQIHPHSPLGGNNGNGAGFTGNASLCGGAGFFGNGIGAGTKSQSYVNGGAGANNTWSGDTGFGGGFGGGGDANRRHNSTYAAGGGGGYSGGGVAYWFSANKSTGGGGGGSYNNGSNQINISGDNLDHGKVTISWSGNSVTFTNCGKTDRLGPSQGDCNTSYSGGPLAGNVTVNAGIQSWTVPTTATYTVIAYGAQGGGPQ